MVCFVDDDVICEGYSVTEEIFLLSSDDKRQGQASSSGRPVNNTADKTDDEQAEDGRSRKTSSPRAKNEPGNTFVITRMTESKEGQ
jgi:hypothetical protein